MAASTAPALDTPELLRLDPKVALCVIASYHNEESIAADYVNITDPAVVSGRRTKVVFTPSAQGQQGGLGREYIGEYELTYNRLDFATFFQNLDTDVVVTSMPTTSRQIAQRLGEKFDIVFTDADIQETPVTQQMTTVVLRAPEKSLRWVGEVTIDIVYYPHLQNVIIPRELPGFDIFEISSLLSDNFQSPVLDGFTKPEITDYLPPGGIGGHWLVTPTNLTTDHTLPSNKMFEQALSNTSGVKFHLEDFEIGPIQESTEPQWEVMVELTPRPGGLYVGVTTVHFNRSDLSLFFDKGEVGFITDETVDQSNIVDFLNEQANLSLVTQDVVYTPTGELTGTVTVASDNLAWKGTVPVTITLPWDFTPVVENMVLIEGTDYYRFRTVQAHSKGPQDTGLPIDRTSLGDWLISLDGGICTLTKPSGQTQTMNISGIANADHIDISFDQNGGLLVVFSEGGNIKLYWYNPQQGSIVVDDFGPGVTPYISITSWNPSIFDSEVVLVYYRDGDIRYRRQDDRYTVEYSLGVDGAGDILHVEINRFDQLVIEYFNKSTNAVSNFATAANGNWVYEPVPSVNNRESEIQILEVRESVRYSEDNEFVNLTNREGEIEFLSVEPIVVHSPSPYEFPDISGREGAIQELRVTDGTYSIAGDEVVPDVSRVVTNFAITTAPAATEITNTEELLTVDYSVSGFTITTEVE